MSYESICTELPTLNRKQLDDIRKRCALLMQNSSVKSDGVEDADFLLEGILHECKQRGVYIGRTFHLKHSGSFAGYATKSVEVRELLLACADPMTPVQRAILGQIAARELANYLKQVSFKAMMDRVDWIPSAIERSFPGYMQSKLLHLVVQYDGEQ